MRMRRIWGQMKDLDKAVRVQAKFFQIFHLWKFAEHGARVDSTPAPKSKKKFFLGIFLCSKNRARQESEEYQKWRMQLEKRAKNRFFSVWPFSAYADPVPTSNSNF